MKQGTFLLFALLVLCPSGWGAAKFQPGTLPLVDGIYDSTQVVVTDHLPVFSWEIGDAVSSFTVTVSSDDVFAASGELWNHTGVTTTVNTINFITRVRYNEDGGAAAALVPGAAYFWQVTLYQDGTSTASARGRFSTVSAAVPLTAPQFDLAVDWNNPFDPSKSQVTRFRFTATDRDRRMRLRVFTLSGELVKEWPEQTVLKDAWYTETWDGKNDGGETVARGIYLVNLADVGEGKGVTRKVAVVK